jgi:hypothetical protein
MRRRKFSREFKLEAVSFGLLPGVRPGWRIFRAWAHGGWDAGAVHEPCRHLVADGAVRTNLVGGTLHFSGVCNVARARAVTAATNIPIPAKIYPIVKILPSAVVGVMSP